MTNEGREYGRRKREGSDEETERRVRETIDDMKRELENGEAHERRELPEQTYCPDEDVRKAIKEIQEEEAERMRLKEQQESEEEEPKEAKEKVKEIPQDWDVERCVRETIQEIEIEKERLREEHEKAEMEKEQHREVSREARKETAEKDNLEDYEEEIKRGFERHGIDPEEVKERWRKKFEEEIKRELGEERESKKETEGKEDGSKGQERTVDGRYYYDDGSGQVYEVKEDSQESSSTEVETSTEVQEKGENPQPEVHEDSEVKRESEEPESRGQGAKPVREKAVQEVPTEQKASERKETSKTETEEEVSIEQEVSKPEKTAKTEVEKEGTEKQERVIDERFQQDNRKRRAESTSESEEEPYSTEIKERTKAEKERVESEDSEEVKESREEQIWNEYEAKYASLEDENYKQYLRETHNAIPEEDQERFKKLVREQARDIDEFKELALRHGLDELLEEEEIMEEIRKYLELRKALENNLDADIERLAEELEIDVESAEEWSRGESEPISLKKLLNLEAYYLWDEILRNYREQDLPKSKEDLESILESDSELKKDRFFELERDEAIVYVIIMAMRRRGEIERKIRNGRELYSRIQIMKLSKKYRILAQEIISWLRGERVHSLVRKISSKKQNQEETSFKVDKQIVSKTPTQLEMAYSSLYYYFRDKKTFEEYINDVERILGIPQENRKELVKTLQELAPQLFIEPPNDYCINHELKRIRGDFIALMNHISGKTLSDLDGKISKLTKTSGRGGIKNPRFPEGEEFEVALARLTAIAVSDCHLKPNGTLEYAESKMSRIKIVERDLQVWGDITLNPKKRNNENLYLSYFPTPLGVMLMHFGIPSGDKSVQNLGLFPACNGFSVSAKCALMEDLIPQDGTISGKKVQWTHTNVLDAADKAETYGIKSKVGKREIDFIKRYGKKEKYGWVLNYGTLDSLRHSKFTQIQHTAKCLWNCIFRNPNLLIEDQIAIVRSIGIEYRSKPYAIRYHKRTGRVSVAWTAEPEALRESIKLGMIAPPNDVVKKKIVKEIIKKHPKYVEEAITHFGSHEVEVDKWWEDE